MSLLDDLKFHFNTNKIKISALDKNIHVGELNKQVQEYLAYNGKLNETRDRVLGSLLFKMIEQKMENNIDVFIRSGVSPALPVNNKRLISQLAVHGLNSCIDNFALKGHGIDSNIAILFYDAKRIDLFMEAIHKLETPEIFKLIPHFAQKGDTFAIKKLSLCHNTKKAHDDRLESEFWGHVLYFGIKHQHSEIVHEALSKSPDIEHCAAKIFSLELSDEQIEAISHVESIKDQTLINFAVSMAKRGKSNAVRNLLKDRLNLLNHINQHALINAIDKITVQSEKTEAIASCLDAMYLQYKDQDTKEHFLERIESFVTEGDFASKNLSPKIKTHIRDYIEHHQPQRNNVTGKSERDVVISKEHFVDRVTDGIHQ